MGGALAAILTRMVRTSMLEELSQDYIRTARAKGLPERTVVYRHALRNAMIPIDSSDMPHLGQSPGRSCWTSGCIGHV